MTLARALQHRTVNNPQVPLTSEALADWLGGGRTKAGSLVSERRVLGMPAYYRAIAIRSGVEAALPLKVYRRGTRQRITQRTVLDSPNPAQKPFAFWQTMRFNGISHGNAFARKVRNGADVVVQVWPIQPARVRVETEDPSDRRPDGKVYLVRHPRTGREESLSSWEIFHVPFMSPDGVTGLSALQAFRESLGVAIAAEDAAGALYANGNRLAGILQAKDELDEPTVTRWRKRWRQLHSGAESTGDIAILDNGAEFKPVTIPPGDAQLLQSRQWAVGEIARMVGVMPHMIGDTERSTSWGTGIESQFIGWVQTMVMPELINISQIVTADLLPGGWDAGSWYAEHALEGLLRGDSAARAQFYGQLIQWGVMTRNEVRALENLEPLEGLDEPLTPSNMTLVTVDGKFQPLGGTNAPTAG